LYNEQKKVLVLYIPGCLQLGVGRTVLLHLRESRAPFECLRVHQGAEISLKALQNLFTSVLAVLFNHSVAKKEKNAQIKKVRDELKDLIEQKQQLPL